MDTRELARDAQAVGEETRARVLEPFISATRAMLLDWAGTEVSAGAVFQKRLHATCADMAAMLGISSRNGGSLVLNFPRHTARGLAERVFRDTVTEITESLVLDSVGELANLIGGHAKALLHGTPYGLTFSTPTILLGPRPIRPEPTDCLVVVFGSDVGDFVLQLFLHE